MGGTHTWVLLLLALASAFSASALPARVLGRQLLVVDNPFFLKGVNWNPVPAGRVQADGVNYRGFVEADGDLMSAAGINAVRTYQPITDVQVLDALWSRGIHVLNSIYVDGDDPIKSVVEPVHRLKDHPAILMWVVGNEWNYNKLYSGLGFWSAAKRVQQVAKLVKALDPLHPVATVYGMLPGPAELKALKDIDIWGINAYHGITFGKLFDEWATRSHKPMFLAEYGADAYNSLVGAVDEKSQAKATVALTEELVAHGTQVGGVCVGGLVFELADEWWKDSKGSPRTHDVGGSAPGDGPYPDKTFNEEYWGLVRNDGTPRVAFQNYADLLLPPGMWRPDWEYDREYMAHITPGYRLRACAASPNCSTLFGNCCPTKAGEFLGCCSQALRQPELRLPLALPDDREPEVDTRRPLDEEEEMLSDVDLPRPAKCALGEAVPCCPDGHCAICSGDQCCPSHSGSVTCPSASTALVEGCIAPKLYDCTQPAGPSRVAGSRKSGKNGTLADEEPAGRPSAQPSKVALRHADNLLVRSSRYAPASAGRLRHLAERLSWSRSWHSALVAALTCMTTAALTGLAVRACSLHAAARERRSYTPPEWLTAGGRTICG